MSPTPAPRKKSLSVQEEKVHDINKHDTAPYYPTPAPRKLSQASEKLSNIEREDKEMTAGNYPIPAPRKSSFAIQSTYKTEVNEPVTMPTPAPRKASMVTDNAMIKNDSPAAQSSSPPLPPPRMTVTAQKTELLPQKVIFRFLIILQKLLLVLVLRTP